MLDSDSPGCTTCPLSRGATAPGGRVVAVGFAAGGAVAGGFAVAVKDSEILAAIPELARGANVFAEPAAAAAWAGLKKAAAEGRVGSRCTAALLVTGNGLKDVASARKSVGRPHVVAPDLAELKRLGRRLRF